MSKITYRPHLLRRIKERKFLKNYPKKIYQKAKMHYLDHDTHHFVAVSDLKYAAKVRHLVVAYDKIGKDIALITIFPLADQELKNKIASGRWVEKNEEKS